MLQGALRLGEDGPRFGLSHVLSLAEVLAEVIAEVLAEDCVENDAPAVFCLPNKAMVGIIIETLTAGDGTAA